MAKVGWLRAVSKVESVGRPDRIGPRNSASDCIHIVRNLEMPSTRISKTASALLMPDCGLALEWLSILTANNLRLRSAGSATGSPLIGESVVASVVVVPSEEVVVARVVVVDVEVVVLSTASAGEHAARINKDTANLLKVERIGGRVSLPGGYTVNTPPVIGRLGMDRSGSSMDTASSIPSALDRRT